MLWLPLAAIAAGGIYLVGRLFSSNNDAPSPPPRRVSRELSDRLVIAFYGAASAGKSSGVKALFDVEVGSIHPIPGTTTEVSWWHLNGHLSVADVPGLQDINEALVQKALDFMDNADILVYVINSNGGITEKVMEDLEHMKTLGRPLLVTLNKIDTIEASQRDEFFFHQSGVAGVPRQDMYPVAFDPLPQISHEPINIVPIKEWIHRTLQNRGEDLLTAKQSGEVV